MATRVTREHTERKKAQAATIMERIGEGDRADEFDDMSGEECRKGRDTDASPECGLGELQ